MFTPGPWEWVKNNFFGGYSGIVGKDNAEVLYPDHCNDGDEGAAWFEEFPSEADRNLIAAAPDMYEALRVAYHRTEDFYLMGLIEEAIAKAEGRKAE